MRKIAGAIALISVAALAACSDATGLQQAGPLVQLATSSSVGEGSGGGGAARTCVLLTFVIANNVATGMVVRLFWHPNMDYVAEATGATEKSCDAIPGATTVLEGITGTNDGCDASLSPWVNNPAYLHPKYGAKPLSRYRESFIDFTGASCVGVPRVLRATLTDLSAGGSVTLTWTPCRASAAPRDCVRLNSNRGAHLERS